MDREAMILYLRNIRDLEVARRIVGEKYQKDKYAYDSAIEQKKSELRTTYKIPGFKYEPPGGCFTFILLVLIAGVIWVIGLAIRMKEKIVEDGWLGYILFLGGILYGLGAMFLVGLYPGSKKTQKENYDRKIDRIKNHNLIASTNNKAVIESIDSLKSEWLRKNEMYKSDYNKLTSLLQSFYNMNLLPMQYRKLSAVSYLYTFMSTGQESFQMALISNQIEEGIIRIEAKIDGITELIREDICQNRLMRDENRYQVQQTIDQNNRMLKHLQSIEDNSNEAARYAELGANYNKANAYFSLAQYLDTKDRG